MELRALSVADLSSVSRFKRRKELSFLHKKKTAHPGEFVNLQRAATVAYSDAQPVTATHFPLPVPTRIDLLLFALDGQEAQTSSLTQISPSCIESPTSYIQPRYPFHQAQLCATDCPRDFHSFKLMATACGLELLNTAQRCLDRHTEDTIQKLPSTNLTCGCPLAWGGGPMIWCCMPVPQRCLQAGFSHRETDCMLEANGDRPGLSRESRH
ncbi:hypothetical protein DFH06DRAFT_577207 [Mycena polygramma]|nr:hypothetical protein DFH06DRAFT_577207 [Mycena polygramma]